MDGLSSRLVFFTASTACSAATIIPRTGPVSLVALGIAAVVGPCSGHIKIVIGTSARRRRLVLSSSQCECSGTIFYLKMFFLRQVFVSRIEFLKLIR
jgi:hypothetical protein